MSRKENMASKPLRQVPSKFGPGRILKLRQSLSGQEAQEIVEAICADQVDALVVSVNRQDKVYVLREPTGSEEENSETVRAICAGEVDAVVVSTPEGEKIHFLQATDSELAKQLRKLTARLQSVREEESTRIAREIHDQLGAALNCLSLEISALAIEGGDAAVRDRVTTISELLSDAIETVQSIAMELRPAVLDVAGLVAAIRAETTKLQERTGMACSFESTLDFFEGPQEASVALFRIFEECLTNVSRHAKASRVDVRLRREPGAVSLEVKDNGKGFDPKAASADGSLGLIGMRERAYSLGGKLSIRSGARKGTAVRVTIPLRS
jgi:signal transduction histidine kinase